MGLRLAIGRCSCKGQESKISIRREICQELLKQLSRIRELSVKQILSLPVENIQEISISGQRVEFATIRETHGQDTLVVIRAFLHTFYFPNYIGIGAVGYCVAEGLWIDSGERIQDAPDSKLWYYK